MFRIKYSIRKQEKILIKKINSNELKDNEKIFFHKWITQWEGNSKDYNKSIS